MRYTEGEVVLKAYNEIDYIVRNSNPLSKAEIIDRLEEIKNNLRDFV